MESEVCSSQTYMYLTDRRQFCPTLMSARTTLSREAVRFVYSTSVLSGWLSCTDHCPLSCAFSEQTIRITGKNFGPGVEDVIEYVK
jgi:hypothetical protein